MNYEGHLLQLREKHNRLENMISDETIRPNPDSIRIAQLKKEKLRIKEEIENIRAS